MTAHRMGLLTALLVPLLLAVPFLGAQETGPEEPDIILPEVILRIEDFSVEDVRVALPEDAELLPRERQIPLPEAGELAVAQPISPLEIGEAREAPDERPVSIVSAQVTLGAGSMNHVYSLISLDRLGQGPRFRLSFLNEALDGIAGEAAGSGFDFRQYNLEGELRMPAGAWTLQGEGFLAQQERGLQRLSPGPDLYASRIAHTAGGAVTLGMPIGERFTVTTGLGLSHTASLLTGPVSGGPDPLALGELLLSPSVGGMFTFGPVWLGLNARYAYRGLSDGSGGVLHRIGAGAVFGVEFLEVYRFEALGGWLYSSAVGHLPPFSLSFTGAPWPVFSFQLSGGYRVDEPSYSGVLELFPFAELPVRLEDNRGWFLDGGANLAIGRSLGLNARVRVDWNSALPLVTGTALTAEGLLPLAQQSGVSLDSEVGVRWRLGAGMSLAGSLSSALLQKSIYDPVHRLGVELEAGPQAATWGARASLDIGLGYDPAVPEISTIPILGLRGFYRLSPAVVLSAEVSDLLYPLVGGPRLTQPPFAVEGLRGSVFVEINL